MHTCTNSHMFEPDLSQASDCRPAGNAIGCQCQWVTWNCNININVSLMLFNKTIRMYYSLFVFRFYSKIICLSFLNFAGRWFAGRGLTRLWLEGMGQACA